MGKTGLRARGLVDRAEANGDPVWLACALASRAEDRYSSASAAVREHANRDLARAVALLAAGTGGALERGTAYIDCGLAYGQRELWELAEEMYAHASALLPACEEPLLVAPLAIDRAMVNVHTACCLREMGDEDGLRRLWERACDTIGDSIGAPVVGTLVGARVGAGLAEAAVPAAFGVETRVGWHLLARSAHEQPVEESAAFDLALTATGAPSEGPDHGLLRLADALRAADLGGWDRVAELAATALLLFEDDVAPPIIAMAMRLATQADIARSSRAATTAMAYCDWSTRRRWDARLQLLAAARASLEAEQLRVERDERARQAHIDELTGLANRRGYTRHVDRLQTRGDRRAVAVLVVDIDAFKAVNDRFGHMVGDAVLVQVARVLSGGIRAADLVARLGGDEFTRAARRSRRPGSPAAGGGQGHRVERLDWSALAPGLGVGISIGIAVGRSDDPQPFLVRADEALYRSKRRGGGIALADD